MIYRYEIYITMTILQYTSIHFVKLIIRNIKKIIHKLDKHKFYNLK